MIPDVSSDAGWVVGILGFLGAAAAALNTYSKARSETNRQVQNDKNATDWQNGLIEENKALRQRMDASWEDRNKDRSTISRLEADVAIWKAKAENDTSIRVLIERENQTLRDELIHQRAQFTLLENLAKK